MALLEVKDLTIAFRSENKTVPAVTDISFSVENGEILALVGESGCGKSVTCMSLSRLLPEVAEIQKGSIELKTRSGETVDILSLEPRSLRKIRGGEIGYIFQEPSVSLNPVFRVGDQIAEALELHRPDVTDVKAETIELLRLVGIPDPVNRIKLYPHEMSGGMQQRVMIAMAIASHPSLLVADEPTTALDVTIQAQILDLLLQLRKDLGMSMILVTHNLGIVSETADRVAVMYAGRIVEYGPVRSLIDNPQHPYTRALLSAVPVLGQQTERLSTIPGSVPLPAEFPAGCRFCTRCTLCAGADAEKQLLCRNEVPPMRKAGNGHYCACHLITPGETVS
ncbi:MAG: ABC transporter ATP-binding protein [Lentisphaeria bacterium]|nr:ABC transporter ATP-binding protein [Lentisphaeria bacterium]